MPNINFDIFYDTDTINITASRGTNAPRAKPDWKIRNAPKLPPRTPPQPPAARAFGPKASDTTSNATPAKSTSSSVAPRRPPPKLESRSKPKNEPAQQAQTQETSEADKPKRKPRKLEVRSKKTESEDTPAETPTDKYSEQGNEHDTETNDES